MNEEEVFAKARELRAAGVPLPEIEKYIQSKLGTGAPADDTVEVSAGYPERLATTILQGAQVIPGMKSFQAAMGSLGSKFTDTPVSYSDAKAGLEEQTGRMGAGRKILAQAVSSPVLAPVMAMRGVSTLSPAAQGAAYGATDAALDINPDETNTSRVLRTAIGGVAGGALAGTVSGVAKFAKAPPGTTGKVASKLFPKTARAVEAYRTATKAPEVVKPQIRLADASAPKADGLLSNTASIASEPTVVAGRTPAPLHLTPVGEPNVADGFIGNGVRNIEEAIKARLQKPSLNDLYSAEAAAADAARVETPGVIQQAVGGKAWDPPWGRPTKDQLAWRAERFKDAIAKRNQP